MARVASLHAKWVRASPLGALCSECQELNALHSQSVDGGKIKIPDRLTNPPDRSESEPYIIDLLAKEREKFAEEFSNEGPLRDAVTASTSKDAEELLVELFRSKQNAVSEYELYNLAKLAVRKHPSLKMSSFLSHIDMSALSTEEKYGLSLAENLSPTEHPYVWNSLIRSDILTPQDLYHKSLNRPFSIQRLYSSKIHGLTTFFEYLRMATQEYTRKLLILKVSFSIFM